MKAQVSFEITPGDSLSLSDLERLNSMAEQQGDSPEGFISKIVKRELLLSAPERATSNPDDHDAEH